MNDLAQGKCRPCEGGIDALRPHEIENLIEQLEGWSLEAATITKTYSFKNHYQTLAFVNAAAWVSHREDHHPDMTVGYNTCKVAYRTHAIDGLSQNDFICAAKLDKLFDL